MDQREWDGMEAKVEAADTRLAAADAALANPAIASDARKLQAALAEQAAAHEAMEAVMDRWGELAERVA